MYTESLEAKLVPVCRGKICSSLTLGWLRFLLCVFYLGLTIAFSGVVANFAVYSYLSENPGTLLLVLLSFPVGIVAYWLLVCWAINLVEFFKIRRS